MKIAVCDDDLYFQQYMKKELEDHYHSLDVLVEVFSSGKALLAALEAEPYGFFCVFMDIEMPEMDGMEATRRIHRLNRKLPVIFLTSHRDMAMEGYELNAFRFLAKPLDQERLCRALAALETEEQGQVRIPVPREGRTFFLPAEDILYIKSENVYVRIVSEQGSYLLRQKLKELLSQLPCTMFCQIHRSYAVNLRKVFSFAGKELVLTDQTVLPVSRGQRESLKKALTRSLAGAAAWK